MLRTVFLALGLVLVIGNLVVGQTPRSLSPRGAASVHVLGNWVRTERQAFSMGGERYQGGHWIDIDYGRPLLRGRSAFSGSGESYGKETYAGAPVWRAGADVSTRLRTDVPLMLGTSVVPPGEYSLFIQLDSPTAWTLIVSSWAAASRFGAPVTEGLFGAFNYTTDKDVARAPMAVSALPWKVEQLTWAFAEVTDRDGMVMIMWDRTVASTRLGFRVP